MAVHHVLQHVQRFGRCRDDKLFAKTAVIRDHAAARLPSSGGQRPRILELRGR
ncbi:hypothetical protein [Streptomyces microflavus]|uniref:hypothetical protein n=1 Tax=Streptomyces microflavus TaxID=1919 RepID=UPI003825E13A